MMLTQTIVPSPSQNCAVRNSSIQRNAPPASSPTPAAQNSPTTLPSTKSILAADGTLGRPGMVMMSPQIMTTNSAPAASRTSRTLTTWFDGAPRTDASVVKDDCVFATQTG